MLDQRAVLAACIALRHEGAVALAQPQDALALRSPQDIRLAVAVRVEKRGDVCIEAWIGTRDLTEGAIALAQVEPSHADGINEHEAALEQEIGESVAVEVGG